jgi:hypothetical protein
MEYIILAVFFGLVFWMTLSEPRLGNKDPQDPFEL